jgi:hypothetical protein
MEAWIEHAYPAVNAALADPQNEKSFLYGNTWFVGTSALPNNKLGAVNGGPALSGDVVDFIERYLRLPAFEWDRGQVSVCFPGYPKPIPGEPESTRHFRLKRDGAHIDGLLAEGAKRRRFIREHHAFVMGIPLVHVDREMSPFVIWEGSHKTIRRAFQNALFGIDAEDWHAVDVTDAYNAARREVFETCPRIEITARRGEAYVVHRLALHGVAPWYGEAGTHSRGRAVIYFRPAFMSAEDWLFHP